MKLETLSSAELFELANRKLLQEKNEAVEEIEFQKLKEPEVNKFKKEIDSLKSAILKLENMQTNNLPHGKFVSNKQKIDEMKSEVDRINDKITRIKRGKKHYDYIESLYAESDFY